MYTVEQETLITAHKPFDVVTNASGDVGYIQEVNINKHQPEVIHQRSYAVNWIVGSERKHAWFYHEELTVHCNLLIEIAKNACHPRGQGSDYVQTLFNAMDR